MKAQKQLNPDFSGQEKLLSKLFLLTFIKETYLFLANCYGFLFHPYLTIKKVVSDRSQLGIFVLLWMGVWLTISAITIVYFLNKWSPFGGRLFHLGLLTIIVTALTFFVASGYLAYWFFVWWQKRRGREQSCN